MSAGYYAAYVAAGSVLAVACYHLSIFYHYVDPGMQGVVEAKRKARADEVAAFLAKHPMSLSSDKIALVKSCKNSSDLLSLYAAGQLKVEEALLYYCHAALEADAHSNCLTEIMFEEALEQARQLDRHHGATGELIGPLHGLPVSLKDCVSYQGKDSTIGVIKFAFKPKAEHAALVRQLLDAGAVPFVKTNVPQTMLTFECRNPLWGRTEHPDLPGFSPGGSSGGEGALIALGGSLLGIGNDVGGSLRIPAHFSGICALKPSWNRVSFHGSTGYYPASLLLHPVNGPMGRTVEDLINLSSVLMGPNAHDARTISLPFDWKLAQDTKRRLRFGLAYTDGFADPVPAVRRALDEAKEALLAAGHEVVEFVYPPDIIRLIALYYAIISGDGGHHFLETLVGEPIDPSLQAFFVGLRMSPRLHRLLSSLLPTLFSDTRVTAIVDALGVKQARSLISLEGERVQAQHTFDRLWRQAGIDVLLCPPNAMPATPYDRFTELNFTATYTLLWNLLDYVAGVLPVSRVNPALDAWPEHHPRPSGSLFRSDVLETMLHRYYDPQAMRGLPVGVQVVGLPYHEEQVLGAMKSLQDALQSNK